MPLCLQSYLGEERGPDWLDIINASSLDQGQELVGLVKVSPSNIQDGMSQEIRTVISTESSARMRAA